MLLARTENNEIKRATKDIVCMCPVCGEQVVPKMGSIKIHHWAHIKKDCDDWAKNESEWHYKWKQDFGLENCEKVIGEHRADIVLDDYIIEIQKSRLSAQQISQREEFYNKHKKLIWVFHIGDYINSTTSKFKIKHPSRKNIPLGFESPNYIEFTWYYAIKSIIEAKSKIYLDLCWGQLIEVNSIKFIGGKALGDGVLIKNDKFIEKIKLSNERKKIQEVLNG